MPVRRRSSPVFASRPRRARTALAVVGFVVAFVALLGALNATVIDLAKSGDEPPHGPHPTAPETHHE